MLRVYYQNMASWYNLRLLIWTKPLAIMQTLSKRAKRHSKRSTKLRIRLNTFSTMLKVKSKLALNQFIRHTLFTRNYQQMLTPISKTTTSTFQTIQFYRKEPNRLLQMIQVKPRQKYRVMFKLIARPSQSQELSLLQSTLMMRSSIAQDLGIPQINLQQLSHNWKRKVRAFRQKRAF